MWKPLSSPNFINRLTCRAVGRNPISINKFLWGSTWGTLQRHALAARKHSRHVTRQWPIKIQSLWTLFPFKFQYHKHSRLKIQFNRKNQLQGFGHKYFGYQFIFNPDPSKHQTPTGWKLRMKITSRDKPSQIGWNLSQNLTSKHRKLPRRQSSRYGDFPRRPFRPKSQPMNVVRETTVIQYQLNHLGPEFNTGPHSFKITLQSFKRLLQTSNSIFSPTILFMDLRSRFSNQKVIFTRTSSDKSSNTLFTVSNQRYTNRSLRGWQSTFIQPPHQVSSISFEICTHHDSSNRTWVRFPYH